MSSFCWQTATAAAVDRTSLKSTYSIRLGKSFANVFAIQMMKIRQLLYKSGSLPLNGAYLSNAIY